MRCPLDLASEERRSDVDGFEYTDTVKGHRVINHGYDYDKGSWRFEHKERVDGRWELVAVKWLDLGPNADKRQDPRERFTLAFPNAYGYAVERCDFAESVPGEAECWHVRFGGEDLHEEDDGFDSEYEAREFLREHLKTQD